MLPTEIRTPRLLLRPWRSEDAAAMKDAVDSSLDHLRASVAWARAEPTPLSALAARLEAFAAAFAKGEEWIYAVLDRSNSRVLGGVAAERAEPALVALVGPETVEAGYWLRADAVGQGYAAEATAALVEAVFAHLGAQRVAICHDPANVASGAVPRRLGFTPHGVVTNAALPARQAADGSVRATTEVWTLEAPR
jgi:RimJ/RimL family protein N-acetyltransferase